MMPKVLNVVKLQKKFATLTRTKESIQSLAGWIMNHREFHEDIVSEWLAGLSKDYNALVMFYVANEIIQNCGKKRVPEFREDFAKVLKKAVSLEKVKTIKENVIRLLSFWRERDIYDETFSKELQSILNSEEIKVDSDDEPSEEEVIARFKKETLIADLDKLKTVVADRKENEDVLKYAEEPVMAESCVSLVPRECHDMIEKCEKYLKLVEETINLTCREVRVKKVVLEDLKDCCIFYSAQSRDVKEVANVFRIYGRKLKIMEKKLLEKKDYFANKESNVSPRFSDATLNSPNSVSSFVSLSDNDSTSILERMSKVSQESPFTSYPETDDSEMQKSFFALLSQDKISENNSLLSDGSITGKSDGNSLNSKDLIKELDSNASSSEHGNANEAKPDTQGSKVGDLNDIDFLLDESYDCKKGNQKPMLKRKTEIRLKLKEKRICTENKTELSNLKLPPPSEEPFRITDDDTFVIKMEDPVSMHVTTEKEKEVALGISTVGVKETDSVHLEYLLDKKETPSNDQLSFKKENEDNSGMNMEVPLEKDTTPTDQFPTKKAGDDPVKISESPLHDKTTLNDKLPNEMDEAPLMEDKTALQDELHNKNTHADSLLHSKTTHTPSLSTSPETSKDGLNNTETDAKLVSVIQKELSSDSASIENKLDNFISDADKSTSTFEKCVVPTDTPQCSETLGTQTVNDSNGVLNSQEVPEEELNGNSPNLLQNLQKVLECICNNQLSYLQTSDSVKEPLLPLENCIALYGALCCPDPVVKNISEVNVPFQALSSTNRQNEVVDMDCETDEES